MSIAFSMAKGDLSDFVFIRPKELAGAAIDGTWSCSGMVFDNFGKKVIEDFSITTKSGDNTEFKAYITPTQSEAFKVGGVYTFSIKLENGTTTPPISKATLLQIQVTANDSL